MWLSEAGAHCDHFGTAKAFFNGIQRDTYDIAILDWELPDMVGDEILKTIRDTLQLQIPAICTTVRDQEDNIVRALKLGADDYMTKPVTKLELLARLDSLLRRARRDFAQTEEFEFPPFAFNMEERSITCDGSPVVVTDRAYNPTQTLPKAITGKNRYAQMLCIKANRTNRIATMPQSERALTNRDGFGLFPKYNPAPSERTATARNATRNPMVFINNTATNTIATSVAVA